MIIKVKVKPASSKDSFELSSDGVYLANIKEDRVNNLANLSLIKIISKEFGVHFSKIKIKNPKGRLKIIEIVK
ncbi:MAG: DUF167 family protein [Candidatus Pacearchaeota archaeon]